MLGRHRGAADITHAGKPNASARKAEIAESLADRAPGREGAKHVVDHRGAARGVDIELVADNQERRAFERNDRVGGIGIESIGEPIDIGVVAIAEC